MQGNRLERPPSIGRESFTGIDIPDDIFMLDVSADKTRMAVIYKTEPVEEAAAEQGQGRYMLKLYNLPTEENGKKAAQNEKFTEQDVSFTTTSINPNYIFLSSSGKNGFVALSFRVAQRNTGRAVFMEAKLALIGRDAVDIYGVCADNAIKKEYTLDTEVLSKGYEAVKHHTDIINGLAWAKFITDGSKKPIPVAANYIITMSRHISNNILVTQYGSNGSGSIVRTWSILDGTLLTSYKFKKVEHVIAISDNYRYIATYDEDEKTTRIYCAKTSVVLHTIPSTAQTDIRNGKYILTYMRFFGDGRYLIISGYKTDTEIPSEYRNYYFEVWCVRAHKLLLIAEIRIYYKSTFSPFVMEFQNRSSRDTEPTPSKKFNPGCQHNLPEMRAIYITKNNQNLIQITAKTLFRQNWIHSLDTVPQTWKVSSGSSPQEPARCKVTLLKKEEDTNLDGLQEGPELNEPLNEFKKLLCYSIQIGADYYILRFGLYTVQLWRLREMEADVSDEYKNDRGFQLKEEGSPYFYRSMEDSELVYIRSYKATDYGTGFTFKEDWSIRVKGAVPEVHFMDETGHLFVEIEHQYGNCKNKRAQPSDENVRALIKTFEQIWPFSTIIKKNESITYKIVDVDEIFLPISNTLTVCTNNRSSIINSTASSTDSNFHDIESACRALHHINGTDTERDGPSLSDEKLKMINNKIYNLILGFLESEKITNYFTTISGSETLTMLASFRRGQSILKYIITTPKIPINVVSYTNGNNVRENALTVLIENNKEYLFNVFFNRALIDSYDAGPGNLSAIMDTLLYLQDQGLSELLFDCSKRLSYIPMNFEHHPILRSEYMPHLHLNSLQQNYVRFRMLKCFSTMEQINKYNNTLRDRALLHRDKIQRNKYNIYFRAVPSAIDWIVFGEKLKNTSLARLCVAPLPLVNDNEKRNKILHNAAYYDINTEGINEDDKLMASMKENDVFEKIAYRRKPNFFTRMTSVSSYNQIFRQGDTVMDVPIQYKWKTFARFKYSLILPICCLYYTSYSTAVTFPQELYNYEPGSIPEHPGHLASIAFMILSSFTLLLQLFKKFRMKKLEYYASSSYHIDVLAFAFPAAAFGLLLTGNNLLRGFDSISILILWAHLILRLRVFAHFGFIVEVAKLSRIIMPVLLMLLLVIFAFTHAFIAQLRLFDDKFFQEQFQGGATDDDGNPIANGTTFTIYDVSSSNIFPNVFRAFSMVWFFIFGVFDPINGGDAGDDTMTIILANLFSFVAVLIVSNMVIAIMLGTLKDVMEFVRRASHFHFATVVAEIEMLWCTSRERYDRKNSPSYIYYVANAKFVKNHVEKMRDETNKLIEELKRGDSHRL